MRSVLLPGLAPLLAALACESPFVIQETAGAAGTLAGDAGEPNGGQPSGGSDPGGGVGAGGAAGANAGSAGEPPAGGAAGAAGAAGSTGDALGECEHPLTALSIAAGENHACAVESITGNLYCWGLGLNGQLGNGATENANAPVLVKSNESFSEVQVGVVTTCALTDDKELFCFGDNSDGVLGDGTSQGSSVPIRALANADTFSMSSSYVLATSSQRDLFAWGGNTDGQLGLGNTTLGSAVRAPSATSQKARRIAAGYSHACLTDEPSLFVYCAGNNQGARLGIAGGSRALFTQVLPEAVTKLTAGYDRTCAVTAQGMKCWGHNLPATFASQPEDITTPTLVSNYMDWQYISLGFDHMCATTTFERVLCAGDNGAGELGREGAASPSFAEPEPSFSANFVSAGRDFTCARRASDYQVVCWGSNANGKLGRGSSDESPGAPGLVCLPPL